MVNGQWSMVNAGMGIAISQTMRDWLDQLESRSKAFAVAAIKLGRELEDGCLVPRSVVWQFIDSATSVGANHRASRQARSDRELVAKLGLVVEETDESVFWLEMIAETATRCPSGQAALIKEARELKSIFAKGLATMRRRVEVD
jgi:four helix bundle protein